MEFPKVSDNDREGRILILWIRLVNVLELQKQPQEINRELKNAREELAIAKQSDEPIEGDRFADRIEVGRIFFLLISSKNKIFLFRISSFVQMTMLLV